MRKLLKKLVVTAAIALPLAAAGGLYAHEPMAPGGSAPNTGMMGQGGAPGMMGSGAMNQGGHGEMMGMMGQMAQMMETCDKTMQSMMSGQGSQMPSQDMPGKHMPGQNMPRIMPGAPNTNG
jgi:hypothetical protein